jgi:hypothetical protein
VTDPTPLRCAAHPDVETNLRCGKCGKPICPRCMVTTPVGARCPDCAKLYRLPTYRVSSSYYLKAVGAGLGIAIVIGVVWGIIESYLPLYFLSLIIAAGIGWVIGEVISLSVNRKRGTWLAIIGGLAVVICYAINYLVDLIRFGFLIFDGYRLLFFLLAVVLGSYMAVSRLR